MITRTTAERLARHRAINQRPKRCPECHDVVQAGNLARHRRRHATRGLDTMRRAA